MTEEEYEKLTEKERRFKVAELCGWKKTINDPKYEPYWKRPDGSGMPIADEMIGAYLPDYLNDLNAMRKAEQMLIGLNNEIKYETYLDKITTDERCPFLWNATAAQRAKAFVLTMDQ